MLPAWANICCQYWSVIRVTETSASWTDVLPFHIQDMHDQAHGWRGYACLSAPQQKIALGGLCANLRRAAKTASAD